MSAFESSPVHCLKPLPCGKYCWPGNGGEAAILIFRNITSEYMQGMHGYLTDYQYLPLLLHLLSHVQGQGTRQPR